MKRLILILAIIIIPLVYIKYDEEEQVIIPKDAIRIRVIANSNSIEDQYEKLEVRENIQLFLRNILKDAKTKQETENIINSNLMNINKNVKNTLKEINSNMKFDVNYGNNYFPAKTFKGVNYEPGYYDSLVITLGRGQGDNWWCVLFPPLCLMQTEEENISDVQYELYINKIISNYK